MLTCDSPSALTDRSWRIPDIELTASSILSVTSVSMLEGAAPGCVVCTETYGNSIFGKRSTPKPRKATNPMTTNELIIIVAKTGRRIETSTSHIV